MPKPFFPCPEVGGVKGHLRIGAPILLERFNKTSEVGLARKVGRIAFINPKAFPAGGRQPGQEGKQQEKRHAFARNRPALMGV